MSGSVFCISCCAFNSFSKNNALISGLYGPAPSLLFRLRVSRHPSLSLESTNKSLNSIKGSIHISPVPISPSIDLSFLTTVHTQQPNLLFPHEGVVVSTTKGQSPLL